MKKVLLIVVAFYVCHGAFSQRMEMMKPESVNEIKVNVATLLFSMPEISYERVWTNNFGLGVSIRGSFSDSFKTKFQLTPYCRFYFGESFIKSFFVEVNAGFQVYKTDNSSDYTTDIYSSPTKNDFDFGVGLAAGYRYVNRSGLIAEVFVGLGRTVNDRVYSRCGVSIGKLF